MKVVAYRHAAYDSPWWAYPSSREGRFHRAGIDTVQYLALHPLAPAAEMLRHNLGPTGNADDALLNLWAAAVDLEDIVVISFNDCASHGITADELVGDDYTPTQVLADRPNRRISRAHRPLCGPTGDREPRSVRYPTAVPVLLEPDQPRGDTDWAPHRWCPASG